MGYALKNAHEDLAGNMWVNLAEANGVPGVDDDGNGYVDDVNGYNFVVEPYLGAKLLPEDHGTHIAGTIAAINNNALGVCGIAGGDSPEGNGVRIMSIQTSYSEYAAYIGNAIVYAADNGAVLMNCSWSIASNESFINNAIDYFNTYAGFDEHGNQAGPMAGGLCVFAAGNENTTVSYPAMNDNVLSVAAIGPDYRKAYYSNYGDWVDISAPGGDANDGATIYSTLTNSSGKYGYMQGTSMACPHVTGVAALVVSRLGGPGFTRQQLIDVLLNSSNQALYDYNSSYKGKLGSGMVDAGAAVSLTDETPMPVENLHAEAQRNEITLSWTVAGNNGSVPYSYDIYYSTKDLGTLDPDDLPYGVQHELFRPQDTGKVGDSMNYTLTGLQFSTGYYIRVRARNLFGIASELSDQVLVYTQQNSVPEITPLDGTTLELKAHETGTLRFQLSDADGQELSFSLVSVGGGSLDGASGILSSDGILTVKVNALKAKENTSYSGRIVISDGYDEVEQSFGYTIAENHAPVSMPIDDIVLNSRTESKSIPLSELFSDEDGEELSYEYETSTTSIVVKCSFTDGEMKLVGNSFGTTDVTVTATDARGESATINFTVLVRDGSRPVDLYPNPVVDVLNIRTGETMKADITISNMAGAVAYSVEGAELAPFSPVQVDMSGQPGGVYYVNVKNDGVNYTYSVAKQ